MKKLTFFIFACLAAVTLFAQGVDTTGVSDIDAFEGKPSADKLMNIYNLLIGAATILWGVIAKAFGLKNKVPNFVFVVIAGGIVIIGGFVSFGLADFFPALISMLGSMGLFDVFRGAAKVGTTSKIADASR